MRQARRADAGYIGDDAAAEGSEATDNLAAFGVDLGNDLVLGGGNIGGISSALFRRQAAGDAGERGFLQLDKGVDQLLALGGDAGDLRVCLQTGVDALAWRTAALLAVEVFGQVNIL
jgi:hypothetical protein